MKSFIKSLTPPVVFDFINNRRGTRWQGEFKNWNDALGKSSGYNSDNVFEAVLKSALLAKSDHEGFERDGVFFKEKKYSLPISMGILLSLQNRAVNVLDFGGSLGSSYFQHRSLLKKFDSVAWSVVEQEKFVEIGQAKFQDKSLMFYSDVDEVFKDRSPDVLIFSSVLQYLEDPYLILTKCLEKDFQYVVIDRTPFSKRNHIKLQVVDSTIYSASYPCWFFSEEEFIDFFRVRGWLLVSSFLNEEGVRAGAQFKGMIFERSK